MRLKKSTTGAQNETKGSTEESEVQARVPVYRFLVSWNPVSRRPACVPQSKGSAGWSGTVIDGHRCTRPDAGNKDTTFGLWDLETTETVSEGVGVFYRPSIGLLSSKPVYKLPSHDIPLLKWWGKLHVNFITLELYYKKKLIMILCTQSNDTVVTCTARSLLRNMKSITPSGLAYHVLQSNH